MGENLDKFYARVRWIKDVWHLTYISSRHSISPLAWSHSCGLCLELGSKEKECVQNFKGIMAKSLRRWFGLFAALSGNIWDPIPQRNRGVLPPWGSTVKGRVHMFWIFRKGENEVLLVLLFCFFFSCQVSLFPPQVTDFIAYTLDVLLLTLTLAYTNFYFIHLDYLKWVMFIKMSDV